MTDAAGKVWEGQSRSVEQTWAIGQAVGRCARAGDLIALIGELGAGKTQLVRGLAEGMGCNPASVASPTFVMVHEYAPGPAGLVLVHIDAYRLKSREDLESIGWDQTGAELRRGAVVAVEWADRLAGALGPDRLEVHLSHQDENGRSLRVMAAGVWQARWEALRAALDQAKIG